jgi:hypothetical protein
MQCDSGNSLGMQEALVANVSQPQIHNDAVPPSGQRHQPIVAEAKWDFRSGQAKNNQQSN